MPGGAGPRTVLPTPHCPRPARRPTPGGPLGLGKGGPLPMCCVSSCTAGISFRGMCPVPPSLQQRRQQNTEAAITQGPASPRLPPVALRPRRHGLPHPPRLLRSQCGAQRPVQRRPRTGGRRADSGEAGLGRSAGAARAGRGGTWGGAGPAGRCAPASAVVFPFGGLA